MECKLQQICKFCQVDAALLIQLPVRELEPVQIVPEVVGGGSIKEKKGGTIRHCKKCDFTVDTGNEGKNKSAILAHFWKEHSKNAAGGKKEKKTAAGKVPKESANDKEAAKAFDNLRQRANKGKLTEEQTTVYDTLEPKIIGLPVAKWPGSYREQVIKLYNEVQN